MMIPSVKKIFKGKEMVFPFELSLSIDGRYAENSISLMKLFLPECEPRLSDNAIIVAVEVKEEKSEKYRL